MFGRAAAVFAISESEHVIMKSRNGFFIVIDAVRIGVACHPPSETGTQKAIRIRPDQSETDSESTGKSMSNWVNLASSLSTEIRPLCS